VVLSEQQLHRRRSLDLEELENACACASAALEAARDATAQAQSVRSALGVVLTRVGESLKRRRAAPQAPDLGSANGQQGLADGGPRLDGGVRLGRAVQP
jgi:hypothetical protein